MIRDTATSNRRTGSGDGSNTDGSAEGAPVDRRRRAFGSAAGALAAGRLLSLPPVGAGAPIRRDGPPHVVLLNVDDLGQHLNCYGVNSVRSPNINAIREDGAKFENTFTPTSSCSPSRAAMLTGRTPHSNGMMGLSHPPFDWRVHKSEPLLPKILSRNGYDTNLFGKYHVVVEDRAWVGYDSVHELVPAPDLADDVIGYLDNRSDPSNDPVYLEIAFAEAHRPFSSTGVTPDRTQGVDVPEWLPNSEATRTELAELQGAIHQVDRAIGRITDAVRETLGSNALVILTSDQGIAMPRAKPTPYDAGIEIPLLVRWPAGGISGGGSWGHLVSNLNIAPTVLDAAGMSPPNSMQERSLLPLLRGNDSGVWNRVFVERTSHSYYYPLRGVRTPKWKFFRRFTQGRNFELAEMKYVPTFTENPHSFGHEKASEVELYDLEKDPIEATNLAYDERYSRVVDRLTAEVAQWMKRTGDPLVDGPIAEPTSRRQRDAMSL